jgi:hypothetical protein
VTKAGYTSFCSHLQLTKWIVPTIITAAQKEGYFSFLTRFLAPFSPVAGVVTDESPLGTVVTAGVVAAELALSPTISIAAAELSPTVSEAAAAAAALSFVGAFRFCKQEEQSLTVIKARERMTRLPSCWE